MVVACDCGGPPGLATITITSPDDGATITRVEDVDPAVDGIQIAVTASSTGFARGDDISVYIVLPGMMIGDADVPVGNSMVDGEANLLFPSVTLDFSGTRQLIARADEGGVTSPPVTITVDDSCATITFVSPEDPGTGRLQLGPADDTDGEMCGVTFETTVTVATDAGDGSRVQVFVNGTPRMSDTVDGAMVTFRNITLDNRGDSPNTLSVTVTRLDGVQCSADFPAQIFVDCAGASCEITRPDSMTPFLNASFDVSVDAGFQGEFDVDTDADGVGQEIRLIIDGDETGAPSALPMPRGMGGRATFGNVDLTEGLHRFVAECEDDAGNFTRSGVIEWTIDTVPCGITIDSPDGSRTITDDLDDTDPGTAGIQLRVTGDYSGADCDMIRVGNCATIDTQTFAVSGAAFDVIADMPTDPMQELCAQVQDLAGNIGEARVSLVVRVDGPQLNILTPAMGTCFNDAGGGAMGCTADLDPPSGSCEAAFSVYCTDVGVDVTLHEMGMAGVLPGGTAPCVADGGVPPPFIGRADFAMVSLPSRESLMPIAIEARQSADGFDGTTSRSFVSDCSPPALSFRRPSCGETLRPSSQDEDPGTPGFQYRVDVFNTNSPKPSVDLTILDSGGGIVDSSSSSLPSAPEIVTEFSFANFTAGGLLTMRACASDAIGNRGCNSDAPCTVNVVEIPTLSIREPSIGAILGAGADCDVGTAGMQIRVRADTDAAVGPMGTVAVGALPVVSPGITAGGSPNQVVDCVDAPEGVGIPVVVSVTDVRGTAMATVTVTIDSMPPALAISDFVPVMPPVDARGGRVSFTWTAVADVGGGNLTGYKARCSSVGPIVDEVGWMGATVVTVPVVPASSGTTQMDILTGFRLGEERWCVLRGADIAGGLTPLPSTAPPSVTIQPTEVVLTTTFGGEGIKVVGIGDINGDTFGDVLVGAAPPTFRSFVHFGSATGPSPTPDITIQGSATFGVAISSLGDISGDGVPDFAVSARAASLSGAVDLSGSVYVFFGRTSSDPAWPANIDVRGAGSCAADLCLTSSVTPALFGWSVAAAGDFDGDGIGDFAIGAYRANADAGRVFVIRGQSAWTAGSTFSLPGATSPDGFMIEAPVSTASMGRSVTTCGDLDADTRADLIVGATGSASIGGRIGRVNGRAYPAATTGLVTIVGTEVTTIDTSTTTVALGEPVVCVGDYNDDGRRDLAAFNATGSSGLVRIYLQSGRSFSAASSLEVRNDGAASSGDLFGASIGQGFHPMFGAIGDLDRFGGADLLLGSSQLGSGPGDVSLFYGRTGATDVARSEANASWNPTTGDATGTRVVANIGDVTGDGYPDFAIGDYNNSSNAGRVLIYY